MKKLKIVVCSKNKLKIKSVKFAFKALGLPCTISALECPSGVRDQPIGYLEAYTGAINRIKHAKGLKKNADIFIAIESGIHRCDITQKVFDFSYSVVEGLTENTRCVSKSTEFEISPVVMHFVDMGSNLSQAAGFVHNMKDIGSTIGISAINSRGKIPRSVLHMQPNIFAICDFLQQQKLSIE